MRLASPLCDICDDFLHPFDLVLTGEEVVSREEWQQSGRHIWRRPTGGLTAQTYIHTRARTHKHIGLNDLLDGVCKASRKWNQIAHYGTKKTEQLSLSHGEVIHYRWLQPV